MKFLIPKTLVVCIPILISAEVAAQKPFSLKSSRVSVNGTSTLHEWTSEVTQVDWAGQLTVDGSNVKEIRNVEVTIPVVSIKSKEGSTMDNKTYGAFKSDQNPSITFKSTSIAIAGSQVTANGSLTMAGTTRAIVLHLEAHVEANGDVSISGSQKLNMKDFQMVPPKAVMGTIKVGPEVTILMELILTPQ